MMRSTLLCLGLLTAISPPSTRAGEKKESDKAAATKELFLVYGGMCSRSMRLQGGYPGASEACRKAADLRAKKMRVEVVIGAKEHPYLNWRAAGYRVYLHSCKNNWRLHTTTDSIVKAREIAEQAKKQGDEAEIVVQGSAH